MTRKRRNILIRALVSMVALLAIAVPMAQAEPGGLFDGSTEARIFAPLSVETATQSEPAQTPVPYLWLLETDGTEPQKVDAAAELRKYEASPMGFLVGATQPDAIARFIDGNAPIVPNAVPGYPAILPEVSTPSVTTDQLPALPPGPGGYVERPFSFDGPGVGFAPTVAPETDLAPFSTDGPRVGTSPDVTVVPVVEPTAGGFDWRDAAIGFSVAAVLALLAAGAVMILRNRDRIATGMS